MARRRRQQPCPDPAVEVSQSRFSRDQTVLFAGQLTGAYTSWQASIRAPLSWLDKVAFDIVGQTMSVEVVIDTVRAVDIRSNHTATDFSGVIGRYIGYAFDRLSIRARRTDGSTDPLDEAEFQVRGWCQAGGEGAGGAGAIVTPGADLWVFQTLPLSAGTTQIRNQTEAGRRDNITAISLTTDDDSARQVQIIRVLGAATETVFAAIMGGAGPDQHSVSLPVPIRGFRATDTDAAVLQVTLSGTANTGHAITVNGYTD